MADVHPTPGANGRSAVERKLASARARLFTRLDELERRVERARAKLDVRNLIRAHPWPALGIALTAGAIVGNAAGGKDAGRFGKQLAALITGLAAHGVRAAATRMIVDKVRGRGPAAIATAPAPAPAPGQAS